jgi:hypothetical protein
MHVHGCVVCDYGLCVSDDCLLAFCMGVFVCCDGFGMFVWAQEIPLDA